MTVNPTHRISTNWRHQNTIPNWRSTSHGQTGWHPSLPSHPRPRDNRPSSRPYLGYCQICSTQGHRAKRCPSFQVIPIPSSNKAPAPHSSTSSTPWQPRAHFAANVASPNSTWLLDSGASHHVTADLNNLSLHAPYTGYDDVMIGDGTGLSITHTGSTSLLTNNSAFQLKDVLCVPDIKTNLISIYQFCVTNNVSVEFLPTCFQVKDLHTGAPLVQGITKDGVYEWSAIKSSSSPPIIAFSSTKTTSSN